MKYNPILACISREIDDVELDGAERHDNLIKAKCIVSFRTSNSYTGTYGFDWVREGDSLRKGDTCYTEIIGGYAGRLAKVKDRKDKKYEEIFVKNPKEYSKFSREFKPLIIPWKSRKKSIYRVPVMSLLKYGSAILNLNLEVKKKPKELRLIYDKNFFKLDRTTVTVPPVGKYTLLDALTIECVEEFNEDQKIQIKAVNKKGKLQLAGELIVKANDKDHRREIDIMLVRVKTNFGTGPRIPVITGIKNVLKKYFAQFYINANFTMINLDLIGDESFNRIHSTPVGLNNPTHTIFTNLNIAFLNANPDISNHDFRKYYKVYFIDEYCNSDSLLCGQANNFHSKEVLILRPGLKDATVAHEMLHALGLHHSFDNESEYTFEKNKTDNIMDYSDFHGIPVISSWQFQWRLVKKHLPKNDNKRNETSV